MAECVDKKHHDSGKLQQEFKKISWQGAFNKKYLGEKIQNLHIVSDERSMFSPVPVLPIELEYRLISADGDNLPRLHKGQLVDIQIKQHLAPR